MMMKYTWPPKMTKRHILNNGIELRVERRVKLGVSYKIFKRCLLLENHLWERIIDPVRDSIR